MSYNLPFERRTLASVLRTDSKRDASGGSYNNPGEKGQSRTERQQGEGWEVQTLMYFDGRAGRIGR